MALEDKVIERERNKERGKDTQTHKQSMLDFKNTSLQLMKWMLNRAGDY